MAVFEFSFGVYRIVKGFTPPQQTSVSRTTYNRSWSPGSISHAATEEAVLRPEEIRLLPERHALVVPENAHPILARLDRAIDGTHGRQLLAAQQAARRRVEHAAATRPTDAMVSAAAVDAAHRLDLTPDRKPTATPTPPATRPPRRGPALRP